MNLRKISTLIVGLLLVLSPLFFTLTSKVYAATSPTLTGASGYSVLGGAAVTNTGTTTTTGAVGVSPGTSITGGTLTAGGGVHSNDASAIAAQADTVSLFTALDQGCDYSYSSGQDLTLLSPLVPGVYCSAGSFLLTGNLTLSGSTGVWIFKTATTLITSSGSSVTGGDPCNVWWRIGSAATLGTTTSFLGNIVTADVADTTALNTGATLNGRVLAQAAQTVTLAGNTISGPTCSASTSTTSSVGSSIGDNSAPNPPCPTIEVGVTAPSIIDSRRVDADSIYISWGPYTGTDDFIVQYGTTKDSLIYNVNVTGFSTTLNDLPANQPIWVQVAARNDCMVGTYAAAVQVGRVTLVGAPGLPNTGYGENNNSKYWMVLAGSILGFGVFYLIRRKKSISE